MNTRWFGDEDRCWRRGLLIIVLLGAVVRLALIFASWHFTLFGDSVDYELHAVSIAAGHGYPPSELASPGTPSAFRPPGYPFLLGGLYALVGVHVQAGRALSAGLGVLSVLLLAFLGRALWGRRVGLLAGAIAAVFPPMVALNGSLLSEALFVPLELAFALSLVILARRPAALRWALAAGVLCGLAALTREVADAWLLVPLAVIVSAAQRPAVRARSAGVLVAAFVLVLTPWTVRNFSELHALVPISTETGYTLAGQYNPEAASTKDGYLAVWRVPFEIPSIEARIGPLFRRPGGVNEVQLNHALLAYGLRYLEHHPEHLVVASVLDTLRLVALGTDNSYLNSLTYQEMGISADLRGLMTLSGQLLVLVALLVLLAALTRRARLVIGPWWLWGVPVLTLALTVPMVGNPLKRAPLDPFLILVVAVGVEAAVMTVRARRRARPVDPLPNGAA